SIRRLPGICPCQLIQKFDGFSVVVCVFQQCSCRFKVLERISDNHNQTAQQIKGAGSVSGGQPDLCEAQEVGAIELMVVNFTGEHELKNFAGGLFVPCFKQLLGRCTQALCRGSFLRIGAVICNLRIESSQLCGQSQLDRDQSGRLRIACCFRQSCDGIGSLQELLGADQIFDPAYLPDT